MKNILNHKIAAFCSVGIILTGHAFAEQETATSQRSPNQYRMSGNPVLEFFDPVFQSHNRLRSDHYARGLGWSTLDRHKYRHTTIYVERVATAPGQPNSHLVSFELWAQPYRGANTGYVKMSRAFVSTQGASPAALKDGPVPVTCVYFGQPNYFPMFRLFEKGRDGTWRKAARYQFRATQPRM